MSTLSGLTAKGEKGKPKFQSLDINNLYKHSRGESSETHQQKSTLPRKHGMQTLGKVPSTRRPPANLPSLKSEHSGNDPAVSLVPSGGSGWGSKPGETGPTPSSQTTTQPSPLTAAPVNQTTPPASVPAVAPTSTAPATITQTPAPSTQSVLGGVKIVGGVLGSGGGDKTWSSVTCGAETAPSFLAHQSPQFQQEFPSLSGEGVGPGPPPPKTDTQYGPGPSLRPQTEGSWIQGGGARGVQGPGGQAPPGNQPTSTPTQDGVRNNLGQFGVVGAQGGQQQSSQGSSNYKSVFPSFMTSRSGYPSMLSGNFQQQQQQQQQQQPQSSARPRYQFPPDSNRGRPAPPLADPEDLIPRPIIREEDLNRMDELARDASWAAQDDIDYNQRLTFSDDETNEDKSGSEKKDKAKPIQNEVKEEKKEPENDKEIREKPVERGTPPSEKSQAWAGRNMPPVSTIPPAEYRGPSGRPGLQGSRVDEDEIWRERRRQQSQVIAVVTEKAKQRKEEEEKRFEESRAKSNQLDPEKKTSKEETSLNESSPPPNSTEWEKEEKNVHVPPPPPSTKEASDNFRQMTQLENRTNFGRDRVNESGYSRPTMIAPRFQRQQQAYNRQQPSSAPPAQPYESRWTSGSSNLQNSHFPGKHSSNDRSNRRNRTESDLSDKEREKEREEDVKERERREKNIPELSSERDRREKDTDRDEPEWEGRRGATEWENNRHYEDRNRRVEAKKSDAFKPSNDAFEERESNDWRGERDRPQRPDSRDSRASRESRNSRDSNREESRLIQESVDNEFTTWGENNYEKEVKEEKPFRKESYKEDRRDNQHRQREGHVPGPITREKMEAYEYKHNLAQGDKKESSVLGGPSGGIEEDTWGSKAGSGGQSGGSGWTEDMPDDAGAPPRTDQATSPKVADATTTSVLEQNKEESADKGSEKEDSGDKKKDNIKKEREKNNRNAGSTGRSIRGGRQGGYTSGGSYAVYNRQNFSRPESKRPQRVPSQKQWNHSDSEVSGDEISASTESGKEDKKDRKQPPRSPKMVERGRKMEKETRNKEQQLQGSLVDGEKPLTPKQERKGGGERKERGEGFAPRGEPSRRGRGGGLRGRGGAMSNVGGHYGPPGSKSPFPHQQAQATSSADLEPIDKNSEDLSLEEKMKMKQQALSAGISGGGGRQQKIGESHQMRKLDGDPQRLNRNKSKLSDQADEAWETTSETSDTEGKGRKGFSKIKTDRKLNNRGPIGDKRMGYNTSQMNGRPGRPEDLKSEEMIGEKKRDKLDSDSSAFTNNGFQEVRNKKIGKDGLGSLSVGRSMKEDSKRGRGGKSVSKEKEGRGGLGVGGPGGRVQGGQAKPFSREWCNKPPRLQRMETLRKQQHHHEVSDMNKMNQSVSLFLSREVGCPPPAPPPSVNAWDKPITATLRTTPPPSSNSLQLGPSINSSQDKTGIEINDHGQSGTSSQTSSPSAEKALTKMAVEKSLLDGTTPPVQTIIFENTNYKAPPSEMAMKSRYNIGPKGQRLDKGRGKIEEELEDSHMSLGGFKAGELKPSDKIQESIQMSIAFNKNEDSADMKLDFPFDSDLTQLTDDKSNMARSDFRIGQTSAADLDQKIASVKKVWDNPAGSMMEHQHHVDESHGVVSTSSSFTPPFGGGVDTSLDPSAAHQVDDSAFTGDVYSSGPQIQGSNSYATSGPNMMKPDSNSASSGVCKVKQQPQPATVVLTQGLPPHSPPLYSQPGHINYQAQFPSGMPGIPSPPAALFGNQQVPNQDLYHSYPLGSTQVLSGQGRSAFSQFPYNMSQGLNQTASYSQFHLQTAPPPSAPPMDFNLYRSPAAPSSFTGSPQLSNNQSTVLISSSANSLMSATVKSSTQPIGTIGSKAAYQSTAPPSAQLYLQYEAPPPLYPQNFMAGSQIVQQRATIQPSPSFYSNSGAQTAGLFQGSSMLGNSGHAPLNSASFGMQGFGTQSPAPAPTGNPNPVGVQNYTSQMGHVRGTSGAVYLKPSGGPSAQHPVDSAKSPSSNQETIQSVFGQQIPSPKSRASSGGGKQPPTPSAPQQPSPTQSHHKFPSYQPHTVSQSNLVMGGGGGQGQGVVGGSGRGVIGGVRGGVGSGGPRYPQPPGPIQRPTYPPQQAMMRHPGPRGLQPAAQPRPLNNKMPNQYFQQTGNPVKLEGTNLEGKCEAGGPEGGGGKAGDGKGKEEVGGGAGQEQ